MCHVETSDATTGVTLQKCNIWIAEVSEATSEHSIRYSHPVDSLSCVFMHMQGCNGSQTPAFPHRTEVFAHGEKKIDSFFFFFSPKTHISIQILF